MAYLKVENKLVTCPYDEAHKVKESRLQLHIAKCKLNHLDKEKEACPFNATHLFDRSERDFHLLNCPDKAPLDRKLAQSLDQNNPFKGRCSVPSYSEAFPVKTDENWDEEISGSGPGYMPKAPYSGAIHEPRPMAKPAERRAMYQDLHRIHADPQNAAEASPSVKPPVPRQPKEESEVQRQNIAAKEQQQNMQVIQNLGLGRGKPPRIAANIFDKPQPASGPVSNAGMSGVVNGFSNLGLGRGSSKGFVSPLDDDDEFPALGCGRGAFRGPPKQSPRAPGASKARN